MNRAHALRALFAANCSHTGPTARHSAASRHAEGAPARDHVQKLANVFAASVDACEGSVIHIDVPESSGSCSRQFCFREARVSSTAVAFRSCHSKQTSSAASPGAKCAAPHLLKPRNTMSRLLGGIQAVGRRPGQVALRQGWQVQHVRSAASGSRRRPDTLRRRRRAICVVGEALRACCPAVSRPDVTTAAGRRIVVKTLEIRPESPGPRVACPKV